METYEEVIGLWANPAQLGSDLGLEGSQVKRVYQWRNRDFIPPEYWRGVIRAARKRGFPGVNVTKLLELAERQYA